MDFDQAVWLHRQGRFAEAAAGYRKVADAQTGRPRYLALLGLTRALADLQRPADAESAAREAVATVPDQFSGHAMLAMALIAQGKFDEAAAPAAHALRRGPGEVNLLNLSASIALHRGRPDEARTFSQSLLKTDPDNQRARSDLVAALRQLGDTAEADRLADPKRVVRSSTIDAPPGFASVEAFNSRLADAIAARGDLHRPKTDTTMIGGARLLDAFTLEAGLADALRAAFTQAAGGRVLSAWANLTRAGDFERPHIHEAGRISGVYYVEVPPDPEGGAIQFGGHPYGGSGSKPPMTVHPAPGQLLLFPSYLHHATTPFAGPGRRISVAFDAGG